jgi:DNA-3-methyladenine glycosylase II
MQFTVPEEILKDPKLAKWVKEHGFIDDKEWKRPRNPFHSLIRSIIFQQVSGKAAASILNKFKKLYPASPKASQGERHGRMPTPTEVISTSEEHLRSAGLSRSKAKYLKDLAAKFQDGTIVPRKFPKMTNDEIVEHLMRVKGIGVWTAHMFLLFTLRRPDILPTLDLAIRKGFQVVYGLKQMPEHAQMEKLARGWRQHASLVSLYLWKFSVMAPKTDKKGTKRTSNQVPNKSISKK